MMLSGLFFGLMFQKEGLDLREWSDSPGVYLPLVMALTWFAASGFLVLLILRDQHEDRNRR